MSIPADIRAARHVRAVRGTVPGYWDLDIRRFLPLPADERESIACPECWAGVPHTASGWAAFHEAPPAGKPAGCPPRIIAERRAEADPCEAGTVGCCIDHSADRGSCETW